MKSLRPIYQPQNIGDWPQGASLPSVQQDFWGNRRAEALGALKAEKVTGIRKPVVAIFSGRAAYDEVLAVLDREELRALLQDLEELHE